MTPDWVGITVSGAITLLAAIASYRLGRHYRRKADFRVAWDFTEIEAPQSWGEGELRFTYRGKELERVAQTYLAIWNDRGDSIRGTDIAQGDPLRLSVEPTDEILAARIVAASGSENGVELLPTGEIRFEFLEPGDGAVIECIHRGSERAWVGGTVIGVSRRVAERAKLDRAGREVARAAPAKRFGLLEESGKLRVLADFFFIGIFVVLIAMISAEFVSETLRSSAPLDPSDFDLMTIEGQQEFAEQLPQWSRESYWWMVVTGGLGVILGISIIGISIRSIAKRLRRAIPPSIVREERDPAPEPGPASTA